MTSSRCRRLVRVAAVAILLLAGVMRDAGATVGLAEWEIETPGGHRISHIDPLKSRHGTCLGKADAVYVEHLEWWRYYRGVVVGRARRGFFVFDESMKTVDYVTTEAALDGEIAKRRLGAPLSARKTPEDGWAEAWGPVFRQRCAEFAKDESAIPESLRPSIREQCARFRSP